MKKSKILALLLTLALAISLSIPVTAIGGKSYATPDSAMSEVRAIALHTPARFAPTADWENITITKETPMYDLLGDLVAYCVDLRNAGTGENAYVFVDARENNYPILQYSPAAVSPYFDQTDRAIFATAGQYYTDNGSAFVDLATGAEFDKQEVLAAVSASAAKAGARTVAAEEDYSEVRQAYITGEFAPTRATEVRLTGVPNLGQPSNLAMACVPTSMAMVLLKQYPGLLPVYSTVYDNITTNTQLIADLYSRMGTSPDPWPNGGTKANRYVSAQGFLQDYGVDYSFAKFDWTKKYALDGNPYPGMTDNPFSVYKDEINEDRALIVMATNNNHTYISPGYPAGFECHAMAGMGYKDDGANSKLIVHTTCVSDGAVYIPYTYAALGTGFAWFIVEP